MAKNSPLAKICDGPIFHLGTTGNDDKNLQHTFLQMGSKAGGPM
jgi:hypothetical protein